MKPIKEYICSQEKLNRKKFFPVILFLFGFAFSFALLLSASAESQTLKSISGKDTSITSEPEFKRRFGWNIKAGSGIYHFEDAIYEINGEMEYFTRKEHSFAINVSQIFSEKIVFSNLITAAPKIYFNIDEFAIFISPGIGLNFIQTKSIDLKVNLGLNLEAGVNIKVGPKNKIILSAKSYLPVFPSQTETFYNQSTVGPYLLFNIGYGF